MKKVVKGRRIKPKKHNTASRTTTGVKEYIPKEFEEDMQKYLEKKERIIIIYTNKEKSRSIMSRCWHFKTNKTNEKFIPLLVDYKPTMAEIEKIRSDPDFSGFNCIKEVKKCSRCNSIFARVE